MVSFDDDPTAGSGEEDEDEEMEDVNEHNQDEDQDQEQDQDGDEDSNGDEDDEDDNDDNGDEEEDEQDQEQDSPTRPRPQQRRQDSSTDDRIPAPAVTLTEPSPHALRSPTTGGPTSHLPPTRPGALTAQAYDIVPTIACPQGTSINALACTPDMRWVFTGGTDGYVRMFDWVSSANGKVPLTVAQKHPFVDSVWKAGNLVTYWENEDNSGNVLRTPPQSNGIVGEEGKWTSPVYSLAVQRQAVWLLSGLEDGAINLQTCRHAAGTRIAMMKEHTSAVSVLSLAQDECSFLSGSWDKSILEWDLNSGKVKRSYRGSGGQISAIEVRPLSEVPVPEVAAEVDTTSGTFGSNNGAAFTNGLANGFGAHDGDEDAVGSPTGSLFGKGLGEDHGSLFGEDTNDASGAGGNMFGDDGDDELSRALNRELQDQDQDAPGEEDAEMTGMGSGGPVQPPESTDIKDAADNNGAASSPLAPNGDATNGVAQPGEAASKSPLPNGMPHADELPTAPPTNESDKPASDLPLQSESTFLDAAQDGTLRIWDRRVSTAIATIVPSGNTPPWATGACWSPDGNSFYVGRRNNAVDEYSIHNLGSKRSEPSRTFKFQAGSGPVYAVRVMPNRRHLVCASNDILRIYDLSQTQTERHRTVPFTIVPGHRGGVISAIHVDPACRFMLSAAGNRGWEGAGTEVLLGYEIGIQDDEGVWRK